jgi:hypothetical protein
MKYLYKLILLASAMLAAPAFAAGPSYEDTVAYLQAKLSGNLVEKSRCQFELGGDIFNAGFLNSIPGMSGYVSDRKSYYAEFKCSDQKKCIKSNKLSELVDYMIFFSPSVKDSKQLSSAVGSLIVLCGGKKISDDLF